MIRLVLFFLMWVTLVSVTMGQEPNYDESQVPNFELPDPLKFEDGRVVGSPEDWRDRRQEILQLFKDHVYGTMPANLPDARHGSAKVVSEQEIEVAIAESDQSGPTIKARIIEVELTFSDRDNGPNAHVLLMLPAGSKERCPLFLGYNFNGNHTVLSAPTIRKSDVWTNERTQIVPTDETRGSSTSRWPIGLILSRGYGVATLYYGDVDPDFDDQFQNGIHSLFPELQHRPDNFSSIGAWAWGLQRVLDYLETVPEIDPKRVAVIGHSRLGKTALWAGATDERFAIVISNDSGCGGAALARRRFGETVAVITSRFPHWFCQRHREYANHEDALPVDQHQLISLIAPRPVYVASAVEDRWADPRGEFLAVCHAASVYALLGYHEPIFAAKNGTSGSVEFKSPPLPNPNQSVGNRLGFHIREGKHDITRFDWLQYLEFADRSLQNQKR